MTIKEIAKIAGVSISTISKVVNGKDSSIGTETRERILKIIKEYNFEPYSDIKKSKTVQSFLIGVLIRSGVQSDALVRGIVKVAKENRYGVLVCLSDSQEEELKNITMLCAHHVDGIIWDPFAGTGKENQNQKYLSEQKTPCFLLRQNNPSEVPCAEIDYCKLGYYLTKRMIEKRHSRIGCLVSGQSAPEEDFIRGYKQCLFENNIRLDEGLCHVWKELADQSNLFFHNVSGIICFDQQIVVNVFEQAASWNMKIPEDLSVAGLMDEEHMIYTNPKLSGTAVPLHSLGEFSCARLIARIEKKRVPEKDFATNIQPVDGGSIDVPKALRNRRIVVVGAINVDTTMYMDSLAKYGQTIHAKSRVILPGGKGVNEAIGAARLGADVDLIGWLGNDFEGRAVYDALNVNKVNTDGVKTDPKLSTGQAYIFVRNDGKSSIVIYGGANDRISPSDIEKSEYAFENASFCLLQTEINIETLEYAAILAKKHNVKVLLKPSAVNKISKTLLKKVDIFMPNKNEINILCPNKSTLEEQAQYFLDSGARTVIVTMASEGCYLRDSEHSIYFGAADFKPVDTTGAADAFAAALAVYLSSSDDILKAIRFATVAAGISITRKGVIPALPDRSMMDLYFSE